MKWILCLFIASLFINCSGNKAKQEPKKQEPKLFEMVKVPLTISDPSARADYVIKNYWNKFNFADTSYISLPEVTEQAFADYVNTLNYASLQTVDASIKNVLKCAEKDSAMFVYFIDLFDKYLYDPNSPTRNEEFYIPVLEGVLASNELNEIEKFRYASLLDLALKNRVGDLAYDFNFIDSSGKKGALSNVKADYTLLYFYNPGCEACQKLQNMLTTSPLIKELLLVKRLKILALYPDEDLSEWEAHKGDIPTSWINAYDKEGVINEKEIYDLKATPTLYLLDKDKKVIFKDAQFSVISEYLYALKTK